MPRRSLLSKTEHSTAPLRSLPNKGEAIRGRFPGGPFPLPRPCSARRRRDRGI